MPPLACRVPGPGMHTARPEPAGQGSCGIDRSAAETVTSRYLHDCNSWIPPDHAVRHGGAYSFVPPVHDQPVLARRCGFHGRDGSTDCSTDATGNATLRGLTQTLGDGIQPGTRDFGNIQCSLSSPQAGPTMGSVSPPRRWPAPGGGSSRGALTA